MYNRGEITETQRGDILPAVNGCLLPTNRVVVEIDDFGQNPDIYGLIPL